ncbi:hypothetical protein BYT27DRAFT_7105790, partial [Phlegmacium glaucopus]
DFANPEVAPHIQPFPEDVDGGPISEMWQVPNGRWYEIPDDKRMPSILEQNKHYYIHEVAELFDGQWVIPHLWIMHHGETKANCYRVIHDTGVCFFNLIVQPAS